jgi:beta-D-xylosidase 4
MAKAAELQWTVGNLARHDESGNTVIYPGRYEVWLDEPVQAVLNFTLTGSERVLDKWPGPAA